MFHLSIFIYSQVSNAQEFNLGSYFGRFDYPKHLQQYTFISMLQHHLMPLQ